MRVQVKWQLCVREYAILVFHGGVVAVVSSGLLSVYLPARNLKMHVGQLRHGDRDKGLQLRHCRSEPATCVNFKAAHACLHAQACLLGLAFSIERHFYPMIAATCAACCSALKGPTSHKRRCLFFIPCTFS